MKKQFYDSIAAASGATGISSDLLKRAKKAGCPLFKGSRVYASGLDKWITDHESEMSRFADADSLKEQKLSEEVRKLRIKNDKDEGKLVSIDFVAWAIAKAGAGVKQSVLAKFVNELPVAVAGLDDVAQCRVVCRRYAEEHLKHCQSLFALFQK